jgi:outer membrane receptor for ferrienterochelin and colicin
VQKLFTFILLTFTIAASAQQRDSLHTDTTRTLKEVTVKGYLTEQPVLSAPASVGLINAGQLKLQSSNSFIPALNTVPGIRAEERSPGVTVCLSVAVCCARRLAYAILRCIMMKYRLPTPAAILT